MQETAVVAPRVTLYVPKGHDEQVIAAGALYWPKLQQTPLPGELKVLSGQLLQELMLEEPVELRKVPVGQGVAADEKAGQ